jgi:hypothetical protein
MKFFLLLSLILTSTAFAQTVEKSEYPARKTATSNIIGMAGCFEAKRAAREEALNICHRDGHNECVIAEDKKIDSSIAKFDISDFNWVQFGYCEYESVAKPKEAFSEEVADSEE